MTIIDFISYSSILMFVFYFISVNVFTKQENKKVQGRPAGTPFTFFIKAKSGSIKIDKAIELIEESSSKK
ncbi:MAG: hypothetical protein ACK4NY_22380 [Spirosomataceae bacterium]